MQTHPPAGRGRLADQADADGYSVFHSSCITAMVIGLIDLMEANQDKHF